MLNNVFIVDEVEFKECWSLKEVISFSSMLRVCCYCVVVSDWDSIASTAQRIFPEIESQIS